MEDNLIFEPLLERVEEYGKTSFELIKLKALNKTTKAVSAFVSKAIVISVAFMFITFLNIGVALWLGDLLGKSYYGFFCVAGFYAIIGIVLYFFFQDQIKKCVGNSFISMMFN